MRRGDAHLPRVALYRDVERDLFVRRPPSEVKDVALRQKDDAYWARYEEAPMEGGASDGGAAIDSDAEALSRIRAAMQGKTDARITGLSLLAPRSDSTVSLGLPTSADARQRETMHQGNH